MATVKDGERYCTSCHNTKLITDFHKLSSEVSETIIYGKQCEDCFERQKNRRNAYVYDSDEMDDEDRQLVGWDASVEDNHVSAQNAHLQEDRGEGQLREDIHVGELSEEDMHDTLDAVLPTQASQRPLLRKELWDRSGSELGVIANEIAEILKGKPNVHNTCQSGFKEYLRHNPDNPQFIARIATFHHSYLGQELPNRLIGDYKIKNKTDTRGFKVLYATMHKLKEAIKGLGLRDIAYILIPAKDIQKSVQQLNKALRQLCRLFAN
jgi:hypothetical protein